MRQPIDETNLAGTAINSISNDADLQDKTNLAERMRLVGCKTKKQYVRYMLRLHNGEKR